MNHIYFKIIKKKETKLIQRGHTALKDNCEFNVWKGIPTFSFKNGEFAKKFAELNDAKLTREKLY